MKLLTLISTLNMSSVTDLVKRMNLQTDAIIINQTNDEGYEEVTIDGLNIKVYRTKNRGVSNSRNLALAKVKDTDIVIIADDNITYVDGYPEIIENEYKHSKADIICFYITAVDRRVKKLSKHIDYLTSMRVVGPELTFRYDKIGDLVFDDIFGTGSRYYMGEENIFVYDALRIGLKIEGCNIKYAVKNNYRPSTWYTGMDEHYLFVKGAVFYRMSPLLSSLYNIQFVLRKYNQYHKYGININQACKLMKNGKKDYKGFIKNQL